jgi:hypothetical protein
MEEEQAKEKVHVSGLPKPADNAIPHYYVHEWTIEPEQPEIVPDNEEVKKAVNPPGAIE